MIHDLHLGERFLRALRTRLSPRAVPDDLFTDPRRVASPDDSHPSMIRIVDNVVEQLAVIGVNASTAAGCGADRAIMDLESASSWTFYLDATTGWAIVKHNHDEDDCAEHHGALSGLPPETSPRLVAELVADHLRETRSDQGAGTTRAER